MRADFTRFPGKMSVRDGVVRGPLVGATVEGNIDYTRDDVHLRGTFVPFYGLNNMFGQIPIVGLFLGGGNKEGLVGINYEAVGPPGCAAHLRQSGQRDRARPAAQIYSVAGHVRPELRPPSPLRWIVSLSSALTICVSFCRVIA